MPRSIKIPPPDRSFAQSSRAGIDLRLVTPMLGGGHEPRKIDEITPISAKGIRGHLRFWWRVMCAAGMETELMAVREAELFGGTDIGSPFDLRITNIAGVHPLEWDEEGGQAEQYVFFPLRDAHGTISRTGSFTLTIEWLSVTTLEGRRTEQRERIKQANERRRRNRNPGLPLPLEQERLTDQLNRALWGWIHFGGIGSRTRRGLGSLEISDRDPDAREIYSFSAGNLPRFAPPAELYVHKAANAGAAWRKAVETYKRFRQSRDPGRPKSTLQRDNKTGDLSHRQFTPPAGRTKWPEPDSIRQDTRCALSPRTVYLDQGRIVAPGPSREQVTFNDHRTPFSTQGTEATLPAYPRAILGMPIVFQFADGPKLGRSTYFKEAGIANTDRDPANTTLLPMVERIDGTIVQGNRMASPIITKPLLIGKEWYAAILILRTPELRALDACLKTTAGATPVPHNQIAGSNVSRFAPMLGKSNALDALASFLRSQNFQRCERAR